jgi:uncharacterized protein YdeI (YjbR/CyaY-like superfamily)
MNEGGRPVLAFASAADFEAWLAVHHEETDGIWLRFFKKRSDMATVTYAEALDIALCYGWIDGQVKALDEASYLQRFSPRRPRSAWSKRNTEHVARLVEEGRMRPPGLREVERAKADGRWERAYSSASRAEPPPDLLAALEGNATAQAAWERLDRTNRYAMIYQVNDARRPETRQRRIAKFVAMLERGEKLY